MLHTGHNLPLTPQILGRTQPAETHPHGPRRASSTPPPWEEDLAQGAALRLTTSYHGSRSCPRSLDFRRTSLPRVVWRPRLASSFTKCNGKTNRTLLGKWVSTWLRCQPQGGNSSTGVPLLRAEDEPGSEFHVVTSLSGSRAAESVRCW